MIHHGRSGSGLFIFTEGLVTNYGEGGGGGGVGRLQNGSVCVCVGGGGTM